MDPRMRVVTDESWLASTGEIRSADLYDGAVIDFRERREGWELPGYDATAWAAGRGRPIRRVADRPRIAPRGAACRHAPACVISQAEGQDASSTGTRTSRVSSDSQSRGKRRTGHGEACRGPRAGRVAPHQIVAIGQGDRQLHARRGDEIDARTGIHLPRISIRRGRDRRRDPRCRVRRNQQRPHPTRPIRVLRPEPQPPP